ncbi:MAG: type V CRISPR-associated protein Cas12a/Cpf1 [Bacteroidales bacterium]|nr:type V CRISPR-associated protein Cas12a/Cpf1 [Bacteroidales bacterium]
MKDLTGQYSLSKTLRFELKPIGKTLEHIEQKGLLTQDEQRAEEYELMKGIIDRYHKAFITMCLRNCKIKVNNTDDELDSLEEYSSLLSKSKRGADDEDKLEKIKENLRKQIVNAFKSGNTYGDLFKKELIKNHLPDFVTDEEEKQVVEHFCNFTTYFTGFHDNRKNMYSDEAKSTAIAYRLIHENFPRFFDNLRSFAKISESEVANRFPEIESAFSLYLNVEHIADMFHVDYFPVVLTQEQIDVYNNIIGGKTEEDGTKIQGINEYINLYNQHHPDVKLPFLKPLYKMILSDKVALSWLPEEFENDEEMLTAINDFYKSVQPVIFGDDENCIRHLLTNIAEYNTDHIYISNDLGLTGISQQLFDQYSIFEDAIKDELRRNVKQTPKEKRNPELLEERIKNLFKKEKSFSISYLDSLIKDKGEDTIESYYAKLGAFDRDGKQTVNLLTQIEMAYIAAKEVLDGKYDNINQSEEATKYIKDLLDAFKSLQHYIKPLLGSGEEAEKDNVFSSQLLNVWEALDVVTPLYNKVRNWLTRKPYSTKKIKLNFENAQLLGGWDMNKEADYASVLLRKNNQYYLAIMDKKHNHAFDIETLPSDGACFEKIDYKLLPGANKMLPKVFFSKSRINEFAPSTDIQIAYRQETHKKGKNFNLADCHRLIDFFKQSIAKHEDWSKFPFHFSDTSTYEDISGFYREVEQQGYTIGFRKISESYIYRLVDEGKLYLFQIWNKDFSDYSKGTPNMHTLYWKALFDKANLADVVYKLNGQAEVFYRKRSLQKENTTVHKALQPIKNKNTQNEKSTSTFDYDIVKDRRYTVDKFHFHVPITINFKSSGRPNINEHVLDIIRHHGIEHVIGIDRGERHLLYLSLIDLKGRIIKQMTLNEIKQQTGGNYGTNYKELLAAREGDRAEARRNWKKIENIKDLKAGYLSQVVHVIAQMMVEYNAIVVLEDLNMGFMRGRQKIERSVYEQFEHMLIDKLNFYVDKKKEACAPGGLLHGLQLANKFESFNKLGKQSGCLFYVPAWNTSKIDPVTGFVNMLDARYESVESSRRFFSRFDVIRYNEEKNWFEFTFDYNNFHAKLDGTKTQWTLCTYGSRIKTFRNPAKLNQWDNEEVVLTDEFKKVFANAGINIHGNLKEAICSLAKREYLEPLMHLMKLLLQLRNSKTNSEVDYMLSPVAENGVFYDSRSCNGNLPIDADANGAYNIARKGLWVLRQIQDSKPGDKLNLALSNKEWLRFVQEKSNFE